MKGNQLLALLLTLAMSLALFAGCSNPQSAPVQSSDAPTEASSLPDPAPTQPEPAQQDTEVAAKPSHESHATIQVPQVISLAADYDEVRALLREAMRSGYGYGAEDEIIEAEAEEAPMDGTNTVSVTPAAEGGRGGFGTDDFGTNVQVAGIDEADNVKTDGTYLYLLDELDVKILRADGANTREIGRIESNLENPTSYDDDGSTYYGGNAILIRGDRLALIYSVNRWGWEADEWYDETETHLAIYDIADRSSPRLLSDLGQDGYYQSCRMKDGSVYLVTVNAVNYFEDDAIPARYIPRICAEGSYRMLEPEQIYLCPNPDYPSFTVVGSYDLSEAALLDACAFTGGTDTVYMNADALYLARSMRVENESDPYAENQYTVVDYYSYASTEIKRIPLDREKLEMDNSCTVEGSLLNQFALDVSNGYLRVATTRNSYSYSIFTDEAYGWDNYYWGDDNERSSSVTVLDSSLNEVGRLDNLGRGERIYSVRFLGDVGYVVTFLNIDPVFTIDLSDPTNPTLESELEVPGVSQYLHLFADGKLFGFGQALEETRSDGLQLSMFNVSDPKNVTLEGKEILDDCYSDALYNHHAILVNGSQNLIGFPMDNYDDWNVSYELYRYDNGSFTRLGSVLLDYYPDGARGILIDGMLYICSSVETSVIDLNDYSVIATLSDAVG